MTVLSKVIKHDQLLKGLINNKLWTTMKLLVLLPNLQLFAQFSLQLSHQVGHSNSWMFAMLSQWILQKEVYLKQAPGFVDPGCPKYMCKLHKALMALNKPLVLGFNNSLHFYSPMDFSIATPMLPYLFVMVHSPLFLCLSMSTISLSQVIMP